jgi:flagellar biosynthetic protein FliP
LTAFSLLPGLVGLAIVLALVVAAAAVARRFMPATGEAGAAERIQVVSRAGLGPRQGVATIRVAGRSAVVSYGDGGVRLLMELDAPGSEAGVGPGWQGGDGETGAGPEVAAPFAASGPIPFRRALAEATRKTWVARALKMAPLVVALLAPAQALAAQLPAARTEATATAAGGAQASLLAAQGVPDIRLQVGGGAGKDLELSGSVGTVLFVGFLTVLPTLLLLMTSFTRILIVLHLLKLALGTQTTPPAHLLTAMAVILTVFVMSPTLEAANERALAPWMAGEMDTSVMLKEASVPFRAFMLDATREQDLNHFVAMSGKPAPESADQLPLTTLTAAFVTSELTNAFQMGFALFLPFVVIDVVVASILMSMGMFMLPPTMVSLPFKLLLFVLVDGWSLILGSLVQSFA